MSRFKWYRWLLGGTWAKWHGRWLRADRSGAISYVDKNGLRHWGHMRSNEITATECYHEVNYF